MNRDLANGAGGGPRNLRLLALNFAIDPPIGLVEPLGRGLINETFRLDSSSGAFVLQRINSRVFPQPELVMENLAVLADHLRGSEALKVPAPIRTREGAPFLRDEHGEVWRLMELVEDATNLESLDSPRQAAQAGAALGRFHRLTHDLDPTRLHIVLPGFHRTPDYLARHLRVRESLGREGLSPDAADLAARIDAHAELADRLERAHAAGRIPLRVTHGDPKLDNILFHRVDGRALALIDLDTVQPGLIQHDLGDCLRSCCNRLGESPDETERVRFDLGVCRNILTAYAAETRDFMTPGDVGGIYDSIRLMPFELAIRFLTDHLEGDRYFRVERPGQNLRKAQAQLDLLADIEAQERQIRGTVAALFGEVPNGY